MKNKIVVGKTKNKATVSICLNCNSYHIPHFNYEKGKRNYSIEFQRAVPIDYGKLMDLKERIDLEKFFATYNENNNSTNWSLAIKTWNENNKEQIPINLHKPYYINMFQELDNYIISTWNNRGCLPDELQIYCNEEVEQQPHFHIKLTDNADVAICFDKPKYLLPLQRALTDTEINIIIKYLNSKCNCEYFRNRFNTNWQYLIFAWNNQNEHSSNYIYPSKNKIDENLAMPDYRNLKKE